MADTKISQLAVADSLDDAVKIPILESDLTNKSTTTNTFWNYIKNKSDAVYQPLDGDLSAIAALTTTGLIEKTGANTASIVTITSAGKNLLDDVSASAQRTTLGLGSASTMTGPSGSIVGTTDNQILTNKTISADNNTLSGIAASSFVLSNASGNIDGSAAQKVIPAGSVVGTTDTQTLDNKALSSLNGGPLAGFRNRIINGNFDIWQRGTSFTPGVGQVIYTADRWSAYTTGAALAIARDAGITTASKYAMSVTGATGNAVFSLGQFVEASNCQFTTGTTLTLSVQLSSSVSRLVYLFVFAAGAEDNFSSATYLTGTGETISTGVNAITLSFQTTDACRNGLSIAIQTENLTTGTLKIGQVQLEPGTVATPFEHRPYSVELALCQRYYYKWIPIGNGNWGDIQIGGTVDQNAYARYPMPSPVLTMRAFPTIGSSGASTFANLTSTGVQQGTVFGYDNGFIILYSPNLTTNQVTVLRRYNNANAYIDFSAEL